MIKSVFYVDNGWIFAIVDNGEIRVVWEPLSNRLDTDMESFMANDVIDLNDLEEDIDPYALKYFTIFAVLVEEK